MRIEGAHADPASAGVDPGEEAIEQSGGPDHAVGRQQTGDGGDRRVQRDVSDGQSVRAEGEVGGVRGAGGEMQRHPHLDGFAGTGAAPLREDLRVAGMLHAGGREGGFVERRRDDPVGVAGETQIRGGRQPIMGGSPSVGADETGRHVASDAARRIETADGVLRAVEQARPAWHLFHRDSFRPRHAGGASEDRGVADHGGSTAGRRPRIGHRGRDDFRAHAGHVPESQQEPRERHRGLRGAVEGTRKEP
ncbi:hypothetical protein LzC2_19230 [Planctomycetes bacterium LzC2]|uniref:Uncharacterized protein n=1 Tax=Alienimonas chondri TaxID=2681879 RepID=A0ABX1VDH4_9PLAN|nr:hypothetical protein [Alienimonas chondri]